MGDKQGGERGEMEGQTGHKRDLRSATWMFFLSELSAQPRGLCPTMQQQREQIAKTEELIAYFVIISLPNNNFQHHH